MDFSHWWDQITAAASWVLERWHLATEPPWWAVALVAAGLAVACAVPPLWRVVRNAMTVVHEMGHATVAWLCGRRVSGISVHTDTSGLTITSGKPRGLGVLLTYLAGYTAPPLVGLGLIWAALSGWSGAAMTALVLLLLAAFWLLRNVFGLVTVSAALALSGWVFWQGEPETVTTYVVAVGIFLLLAACRGAFDLWAIHDRGEGASSDASMAARHSLLPARFWVWLFGVFSALCALQAGGLIALALT